MKKPRTKVTTTDEAQKFIDKADKTDAELEAKAEEEKTKAADDEKVRIEAEEKAKKEVRKKQAGYKVNEYELAELMELTEYLDRSLSATLRFAVGEQIKEMKRKKVLESNKK